MSKLQIILVIKDNKKNVLAYVTNDLQYLKPAEAIKLVLKGSLEHLHVGKKGSSQYLRSNRNRIKQDNLRNNTLSTKQFLKFLKGIDLEQQAALTFWEFYAKSLEQIYNKKDLLYIDGMARIRIDAISHRFKPLVGLIKKTAQKYEIDQSLLGAILIDEFARMSPQDLIDILGMAGYDFSVGLAQVKMSTAKLLISKGYSEVPSKISDAKLYLLLMTDEGAINFAAAYIKFVKDFRVRNGLPVDHESLATCYSGKLNSKKASSRGKQIATIFIKLAKKILK